MTTLKKNSFYTQHGILRHKMLNGDKIFLPWMYQPLIPWNTSILKLPSEHLSKKEISLGAIVGSTHPDYDGLNSWIEFLGALKKVSDKESLIYYSKYFKENKEAFDV